MILHKPFSAGMLVDKIEPTDATYSPKLDLPHVDDPPRHHHLRTDSQLSSSDASLTPASGMWPLTLS